MTTVLVALGFARSVAVSRKPVVTVASGSRSVTQSPPSVVQASGLVRSRKTTWRRGGERGEMGVAVSLDRKSTRLNSSHQIISYAVFCLKKKKKKMDTMRLVHIYSIC